ncbi:MAG: sulfotransferase domain-containing protein [Ekhidna sp.]|nr:sulfotransferase domain-containing protein [Ekhidna sp.]
MASRIIQIGFPKTGTTYLQKNVYPHLSGVKYYDYWTCDKLFYDMIYLDKIDYDYEKNKRTITPYFNKEKVLFSFESLAGSPFIYKGANRSQIPVRLKDAGFNKIIITLRNQVDIIDSMYRQYIVQGGVMRFKDFLDLEEKWKLSVRPFYLGYLEYEKLIKLYHEAFGKENVLVLFQENLKRDHNAFINELLSFIGEVKFNQPAKTHTKNESLTNLSTSFLRICNHFIFAYSKISKRLVFKVFKVILDPYFFRLVSSKKSFLKNSSREYISEYYKESNSKLQSLLGSDFKLY